MDVLNGVRSALRDAPRDDRRVLRIVTIMVLAVTLVNVLVWAMVGLISRDLDDPWWLWFALPAAVVLTVAWWWTAPRPSA